MATTKMTKVQVLNAIRNRIEVFDDSFIEDMTNDELLAWIDHEVGLLSKKAGGSAKPTKSQIAGDADSQVILEVMEAADRPMTVGEIRQACAGRLAGAVSSQRVTFLLTKMKGTRVHQWKEKKVSLYEVMKGNAEDDGETEE